MGRPLVRRQRIGIGPAFDKNETTSTFPILMERVFKASDFVSAWLDRLLEDVGHGLFVTRLRLNNGDKADFRGGGLVLLHH
nr:hypothetical protein [uncultured Celeribacter sp.]